jgi:P-type Ca2+ transporter type 2C
MASESLRVLAFAFKDIKEKFSQENAETELIFLGFQGMLDIPRKEVKSAIRECKNAGIKVKMITGDSEITAKAIARMIDINEESIVGTELEKLSQSEFDKIVKEKTIFARITPELKLKIIQSLKKQNEVIAVTGDGINDVLALKEAHIGIAMGIRGTDVTREAADIILLDDNFGTIVNAVREGRKVYDNMKKSIKFHLSANFGELLLVLVALLISLPLPILPLAILWMNLVTDALPSLALSIEKEEKDIMKREAINPNEDILKRIYKFIIIAGILSAVISLILFASFYQEDLQKARTITLTYFIFSEFFIAFACRSEDRNIWKIGFFSNKFLLISVIIAAILQLIAIYTPLSTVFGLQSISILELILAIGLSSLGFIIFEIMKFFKVKI